MQIRKAELKDFDQVMAILRDGRNQLAESGIEQWKGGLPEP